MGLCMGWGEIRTGLGTGLLPGFFRFFSQFYTPQSLGIHLVSYCYSPRLKPESKRLAVNEPGKIYNHIRSSGSRVIKGEVQGGV